MNINSKRLSIYLVLMLVGTAIATALRSVACVVYMDYELGYFENKTLISIAEPIIWGTVIVMFTYLFAGSRVNLKASFSTSATYIPSGILGVATFYLGVRVLTYAMKLTRYPLLSKESLTTPAVLIALLIAIASVVSVAHYFYTSFVTESKSNLRAYFSIGTIVFLALYSILTYMDTTVATNAPTKLVNQMAYIFCAIFFLYESRISLGREKWRAYCAFGLISAALAGYASIPALITYYAKGVVLGASASGGSLVSVEEYMVTFALFIFILARLVITVSLTESKENKLVSAMAEYAEKREKEVEESFERHQEDFAAKQLSLFELYEQESEPVEEKEEEIVREEAPTEEEPKEITLSDDVIYESIFGTMPSKDEEDTKTDKDIGEIQEKKPKNSEEIAHAPAETDNKSSFSEPEVLPDDILAEIDEAIKRIENENKE